jgi:hypothetical protein
MPHLVVQQHQNLQANVMSIQEYKALKKDVVDDRPSEENKALGNVS